MMKYFIHALALLFMISQNVFAQDGVASSNPKTGIYGSFSCTTPSGIHVDVNHVFQQSSAYEYSYIYTQVILSGSATGTFKTQKNAEPTQTLQDGTLLYPFSYTDSSTGFALNIQTVYQSAYANGFLTVSKTAQPQKVDCIYTAVFEISPPLRVISAAIEN